MSLQHCIAMGGATILSEAMIADVVDIGYGCTYASNKPLPPNFNYICVYMITHLCTVLPREGVLLVYLGFASVAP